VRTLINFNMHTIQLPKPTAFLILILSLIVLPLIGVRRAEAQTTTSNAFIAADVENESGLITIYLAGTSPKEFLTYVDHSYLTVHIGSDFYTNNPYANVVEPSGTTVNPILLNTSGKTSLLHGVIQGTDTIQTVWQPKGPNAFDIVQDVYPVAGVSSGQIVYKWSIVDRAATGLTTQAQLLLDLLTTSHNPDTGNDSPAVTTRDGYNVRRWQDFSNTMPYFLTSEYPVCTSDHFPGIMGAGYTVDDFAPVPMGLLRPSDLAVVDADAIMQQFLFGFPDSLSGKPMEGFDNGMLIQWPPTGVFGASSGTPTVKEIGRGSYGTASCTPITQGNLDAILLHPDHITWKDSMYVPNHFPVEAIVWNANNTGTASGAIATQTISNSITGQHSGPIQVISPAPIGDDGYMQSHVVQSGGSSTADSLVPECGMGFVTWEDTVLADVLTNCSDSSYDITLSVSAANVQQPIFPFGLPVCPILVDCQGKTKVPPTAPTSTILSRTGSFDGSNCNARCTDVVAFDTGGIRIPVTSIMSNVMTNMRLTIAPSHAGADSLDYSVCIIDSMQAGSASLWVIDSVGNSIPEQYSYCTIPDTHKPLLFGNPVEDTCSCFVYTITDSQAWDRGLDSITVYGLNNITVDAISPRRSDLQGLNEAYISGHFLTGKQRTICISAVDFAGNKFDTCISFAMANVSPLPTYNLIFTVAPNPATAVVTISLSGAPSANIEIYDVLGREVTSFRMAESYEWQMSTLPVGTYIVRATSDGTVVSRRVVKE
jgi:hypothetical protein